MLWKYYGVSKARFFKMLALRTVGNFLVLFSLYMLAWVFTDPLIEEIKYTYDKLTGKEYVLVDEVAETREKSSFHIQQNEREKGLLGNALNFNDIEVLVPNDPNFSVVIPKLGANANVISNVDSADKDSYLDALQQGVAHASGTKFPGEDGHIYLFAHSTNTFSNVNRYNAVFYLLYKLEQGDEVNIYYKGVRHTYRVTGKKIVDPSEVQYLTRKTDSEFLTMQTCWPPGTVTQRMLVFAEPVAQ